MSLGHIRMTQKSQSRLLKQPRLILVVGGRFDGAIRETRQQPLAGFDVLGAAEDLAGFFVGGDRVAAAEDVFRGERAELGVQCLDVEAAILVIMRRGDVQAVE